MRFYFSGWTGPRVGRRISRTIGTEQRSNETLLGMLILCTGIGFFFGAVIGAPAGFIINVTRNWR